MVSVEDVLKAEGGLGVKLSLNEKIWLEKTLSASEFDSSADAVWTSSRFEC